MCANAERVSLSTWLLSGKKRNSQRMAYTPITEREGWERILYNPTTNKEGLGKNSILSSTNREIGKNASIDSTL